MFTLTIELSNAAFEDGAMPDEIARILRATAEKIECGFPAGKTRDINGNVVGAFETVADA